MSFTPSAPADHFFAITPEDDADLEHTTRGIYVGTAGDLNVTSVNDETVLHKNVSGYLPIRVKQVQLTGTTAADIVGWY